MKLLLATRNQGKIAELRELLEAAGIELSLFSLWDFPEIPEEKEKGTSFWENAREKALAGVRRLRLLTLADDSGLEVDALGGKPGVQSARFAGEPCDDAKNNQKLLALLSSVPWEKRTARFRCVLALATPEEEVYFTEGICAGYIGYALRGEGGFGYDPLFFLPAYGCTLAELSPSLKNKISHRGKAWRQMLRILKTFL